MRKLAALILLLPLSAWATNYTVKAGGGGNYTTIAACAAAMANGDTCAVYAGTYNEHPSIPSGGSGAYKTITVNSGDTVYVQGFSIASHDKINGFHIQNTSSPASASCVSVGSAATDSYVTNNVMYACAGVNTAQSSPHVSNIYFTGNTISYPYCTSSAPDTGDAFSIHCDGCLFANNDISHTSDGFTELDGTNNVIVGNTFHDNLLSECVINGHGGNCHIDFVATEPNVPGGGYATADLLIEGNSLWNCNSSPGCHEYLMQADSCSGQCLRNKIRFNNASGFSSAGVENDNSWTGVYNYNNTEVNVAVGFGGTGGGGIADSCSNSATNCQYKNNLYYYIGTITDFNAIGVSGGTLTSASHNLAWCTAGSGSCTLHGTTYGSGTWTGSGQTLANPLLVSPSTTGTALGDNHLQTGSPALNGGANLTAVNGSVSSSTTLVVTDAGFFHANPAGIPGVSADCIAVTSVSNHVCITSINYSTNTLALASPVTAANGDSVWLYSDSTGTVRLTGTAPNMGALGTNTAPGTPTNLSGSISIVGIVN